MLLTDYYQLNRFIKKNLHHTVILFKRALRTGQRDNTKKLLDLYQKAKIVLYDQKNILIVFDKD